jgi:ABC-type microcin C transport system duplicated ATPase subunit YejF
LRKASRRCADIAPAERTQRVAALLEQVGLRRDVLTRYPRYEFWRPGASRSPGRWRWSPA